MIKYKELKINSVDTFAAKASEISKDLISTLQALEVFELKKSWCKNK